MLQNRKYRALLISMCLLMWITGCENNSNKEDVIIVSEPYSIMIYFEKKHSKDIINIRIFEANTKRQFDRLVNKYQMHYDQGNCIYEFDEKFFKHNKVYIIHTNYWNEPYARKYKVEKNNNIIDLVIYEAIPAFITNEVKKGAHGDLLAVSKEFAKDVKEVRVRYKDYNEYDGD